MPARLAGAALVLLIVRLMAPAIPFTINGYRTTLGQAHALCASSAGLLAQATDPTAAADCSNIAAGYDLLNACTVVAVACLAGVAWLLLRPGRPPETSP